MTPSRPNVCQFFSNHRGSRRVLVAPDSFKGIWSPARAAQEIARPFEAAGWDVDLCPLADGGEGTAEVLGVALGAKERQTRVSGPLPGMTVDASWWWVESQSLALMDMASAAGLTLIHPEDRDPLRATTAGVGELLREARLVGAREIWLGAGGSGTVDCGSGMAQIFGWQFLGRHGSLSPGGGSLADLQRLVPPLDPNPLPFLTVLCDVTTPLSEAARIFSPQKGADPPAVERLEAGLARLVEVARETGHQMPEGRHTGAAGGLAAGAVTFLGAELVPGVERVLEIVGFTERLQGADLVVTGEGQLDGTSFEGKVLAGVLEAADRVGVPVGVVAAEVAMEEADVRARGIEWVEEFATFQETGKY